MSVDHSADPRQGTPDDRLHRALRELDHRRATPTTDTDWRSLLAAEYELRVQELELVDRECAQMEPLLTEVPTEPAAFIAWFEALERTGPGQHDPLFDWLAHEAPRDAMRWFVQQELAGEAGFDDLVALTQVRMPTRPKLELARNYWDEMGQGHAGGMHGPMLQALAQELGIARDAPTVRESLALANLMTALASNRHLAYQSIGALGAIELTAPGRSTRVNSGLGRLGIDGAARRYFAVHATLDVRHSRAWNEEVLRPLVERDPALARPIAQGALLRLTAGARCFLRYRRELGLM